MHLNTGAQLSARILSARYYLGRVSMASDFRQYSC
jgi:hypothetical protein